MASRSPRETRTGGGPERRSPPAPANLVQRKCACGGRAGATGQCAECTKTQRTIQRAGAEEGAPLVAPPVVDEVLRSSGQPLDPATRLTMESRFGHDFNDVRVHTDARAADAARAVNALAYTVGKDLVFAEGQYAPTTEQGKTLLAHELAHVVQQGPQTVAPGAPLVIGSASHALEREAERLAAGPLARAPLAAPPGLIQRQAPKGGKKTSGAKAAGTTPGITLTFGQVRFEDEARKDLLKGGALLVGADNAHIGLSGDGLLGYDAAYTDPEDPFRWQKVKDLVDSGQKILVRKVGLGDTIKVRFIHKDKTTDVSAPLTEAGLTLPTEAFQRKIYPTHTGPITASPSPDTHRVYYTGGDLLDPARSSLPHELMGHMWLALKDVPFVHPKAPADIVARGTLETKHGVKDPLGGTYTGPVKDFIDRYVGSELMSRLKSPTQFVSRGQLDAALARLKDGFATRASGTLNGPWEVPGDMASAWEIIGTNYEMAGLADPALEKRIVADVAAWYAGLSAERQYVFLRFLAAMRKDFLQKTRLASALLGVLKRPAGMRGDND